MLPRKHRQDSFGAPASEYTPASSPGLALLLHPSRPHHDRRISYALATYFQSTSGAREPNRLFAGSVSTEARGIMPRKVTLDAAIRMSKRAVLVAVRRPGELVLIRLGRTLSGSGLGLVALGRAGWRADAAAKPVGAPTRAASGAFRDVMGPIGSTCFTGDPIGSSGDGRGGIGAVEIGDVREPPIHAIATYRTRLRYCPHARVGLSKLPAPRVQFEVAVTCLRRYCRGNGTGWQAARKVGVKSPACTPSQGEASACYISGIWIAALPPSRDSSGSAIRDSRLARDKCMG